MAYVLELSPEDKIYLENQEMQTTITALGHSRGQQQIAGSSIYTGKWNRTPCVYQTQEGVVFHVQTEQKEYYIQVAGSSMSVVGGRPGVLGESLQLQEISNSPVSSIKPMQPMQPMQPMRPFEAMQPIEKQMGVKLFNKFYP